MRTLLSSLGILALLCLPARAQCRSWSPGFAAPALPGSAFTLVSFDDGNGDRLYGTINSPGAGVDRVVRWTESSWEPVLELATPNVSFWDLFEADEGGVPVLLAGYSTLTFPEQTDVWRYDGASWTQIGTLPFLVEHMGTYDDGSGPALFAGGAAGQTQGYVSRWNGTSWSQVGPTFAKPVSSLASFDDGSGTKLFAGGWDPAIVPGSTVASWNGSAWTAVGVLNRAINELRPYSGQLYAAIQLPGSAGGLLRWNAGSWSGISPPPSSVFDLDEIDFGSGPMLTVAHGFGLGLLTTPGGVPTLAGVAGVNSTSVYRAVPHAGPGGPQLAITGSFSLAGGLPTSNFALWDGATWSTLGRGFDGPVVTLAVHDDGNGARLHAGGTFGLSGYGASMASVHRWDGANWSRIGAIGEEYVVRSLDLGSGAQLYAGGHNLLNDPYRGVTLWNGMQWLAFAPQIGGDVHCLAVHDSGAGPQLVAGGNFLQSTSGAGNKITRLVAGTWTPLGSGMNGIVAALCTYDEGLGGMLFAGGAFTTAGGVTTGGLARWDGSAWSALGTGITGAVNALCVYDDGNGAQLYAGGTFTNVSGLPVSFLARWNGSAWSDLPGSGANGAVLALHVHDDGRGPALYVGGGFSTIGGITAYNAARFDGAGWEMVDGGLDNVVRAFASVDDDGDGDAELFVGGDFTSTASLASGRIARLAGCPHHESFCFGDGTLVDHTTPCPCANNGAPGHGCANPFDASGALLAASGSTNPETLVLAGSGMPLLAYGLYLQHDAAGDHVFHDGVLCAGGNLIRLRNRNAFGGASTFPDSTDTVTISQRGMVTPGGGALRYYSLYYRSASPTFCPPATANVTNGVRVIW